MESGIDVTVAICTRDRPASLSRTLSSFEDLHLPPELRWELLVVDNGGAAPAADAVARHSDGLPVRLAHESTPGLSAARNRAASMARGETIVWTDDDVQVEEGWLVSYWRAFRRWEDDAFFGGPVTPRFQGDPPSWLAAVLPRIAGVYAARDLGSEPIRFGEGARELPYGANFAVRTHVQRRFRYDPRLGRRPGGGLLGGEEMDVFRRMLHAGHSGRWVPGSRVHHVIPPERQTLRYVRRYLEAEGLRSPNPADPTERKPTWQRLCIYTYRALRDEASFRWHRLSASPERWIEDLLKVSEARGRLRALLMGRDGDPRRRTGPAGDPRRSGRT